MLEIKSNIKTPEQHITLLATSKSRLEELFNLKFMNYKFAVGKEQRPVRYESSDPSLNTQPNFTKFCKKEKKPKENK